MEDRTGSLEELLQIMDKLLSLEGCPWDREQTHASLVRYLIEESYEVIEAIEHQDMDRLREELGDLLLQVVFHAALAEREGWFNFDDVARTVSRKMIDRHPHVFGSLQLESSEAVMENWEDFKKKEGKKHLLEGIPAMLPALMRAEKMQEKAARVGFDWADVGGALEKFKEEADELARAQGEQEVREETGDLLFALVNIARFKGVEPEQALQATNDKFARRFRYIEEQLRLRQRDLKQASLQEMDELWEEAKSLGL
jgi:tetrapyrrole methylase family protein/MazG family protein